MFHVVLEGKFRVQTGFYSLFGTIHVCVHPLISQTHLCHNFWSESYASGHISTGAVYARMLERTYLELSKVLNSTWQLSIATNGDGEIPNRLCEPWQQIWCGCNWKSEKNTVQILWSKAWWCITCAYYCQLQTIIRYDCVCYSAEQTVGCFLLCVVRAIANAIYKHISSVFISGIDWKSHVAFDAVGIMQAFTISIWSDSLRVGTTKRPPPIHVRESLCAG